VSVIIMCVCYKSVSVLGVCVYHKSVCLLCVNKALHWGTFVGLFSHYCRSVCLSWRCVSVIRVCVTVD